MALETLLLSAVLPAAVDLVKGLGNRIGNKMFGVTIDDQIKQQDANIRQMEAVAKLDNPYGTPSQWVIDLRASFRYIAAAILVISGLAIAAYGAYKADQAVIAAGLETASVPAVFIFGERMWNGFKGAK